MFDSQPRTRAKPPAAPAVTGKQAQWAWIALTIWSVAMLVCCASTGMRHDYVSYVSQWHLVLAGSNPWATDNAYGPLHNLLALLLPLGHLAPKLLIATALLLANFFLVHELLKLQPSAVILYGYLLAVPGNFLIITMAFAYGLNDALVAAFVALAVLARNRDRGARAGALLGLAVLLKYYPLFLVPFFALEKGRIKVSVVAAALVVISAGLAISMSIWADAFLAPFHFGMDRPPKIMSILSALQSDPNLVGGRRMLDFLVRRNAWFVIAVAGLSVFVAWKLRMHWLETSVLGLLAILLTYKVGHQQFYIPWLFLVAALPLAQTSSSRKLLILCLPFIVFLSALQLDYFLTNGGEHFTTVRKYVGFVAFALGVTTILTYFRIFRHQQS